MRAPAPDARLPHRDRALGGVGEACPTAGIVIAPATRRAEAAEEEAEAAEEAAAEAEEEEAEAEAAAAAEEEAEEAAVARWVRKFTASPAEKRSLIA